MPSRHDFAVDLLRAINAPLYNGNIVAILAWIQAEGGNAKCNPLNTTQPATNASDYNSVHVKNYTNYSVGLAATVLTLALPRYAGIRDALNRRVSTKDVLEAVNASDWGTGLDPAAMEATIRNDWAFADIPIVGSEHE